MALTYKTFAARHPEYDPDAWKMQRALYVGGRFMLLDGVLMGQLLPQHPAEPDGQYRIRRKMAYYENVVGSVVDYLAGSLSQDPLRVEGSEDTTVPDYYDAFADDTSGPGGKTCTLAELVKDCVQGVLLHRRQWLRIDMPPSSGEHRNLGQQETAGELRAYAMTLEPETVVEWEYAADGAELSWVMLCSRFSRREALESSRTIVTERYTLISAEASQTYDFVFDSAKTLKPKDDAQPVIGPLMPHSFGKVPILCMEPPGSARGLHALAMLEPLARRHVEAINALAYAEARVLFTPRTVFLDPGSPVMGELPSEAEAADRAITQAHGTAAVVQMKAAPGGGDSVGYPGPDPSAFAHARASCDALVEAMHRCLQQMALTVKASASALQRSGDSKAQDRAASEIILGALGEMIRTFVATELYPMLARGRDPQNAGGEQDIEWSALGLEKFDSASFADKLAEATQWALLEIPSPRAQTLHLMDLIRSHFGDRISEDDYVTIERELTEGTSQDNAMALVSRAADGAMKAELVAEPAVEVRGS